MTPETFVTDGINTTYATAQKFRANTTLLFLNGVYQGLGRDYTEGANFKSIVFVVLPDAGGEGEIRYLIDEEIKTAVEGVTTFKEQLAADAVNALLNVDEFAEAIVYTPKNGTPKSIKAIVERRRVSPAGEDSGRVLENQAEIFIANNATYGVTSIKKGEDKVSLPERLGQADINWIVADVLGQDDGMWRLLCEK